MADQSLQPARGITRREFLNYVWAASLALFMAEMGGAIYAFALPRFKAGEFGGAFTAGSVAEKLPAPDTPPVPHPNVKVWLINVGPDASAKGGSPTGVLALYKVCVHLGCLYAWVDSTDRFECPCHGSKYQLDGTYIEGPAPRDCDRFLVQLVDKAGNVVAQTDTERSSPNYGAPLPLPPNAENLTIVVQTGEIINLGKRKFYAKAT